MGLGFAPTWLRQVSPPGPDSHDHSNHWLYIMRVMADVLIADPSADSCVRYTFVQRFLRWTSHPGRDRQPYEEVLGALLLCLSDSAFWIRRWRQEIQNVVYYEGHNQRTNLSYPVIGDDGISGSRISENWLVLIGLGRLLQIRRGSRILQKTWPVDHRRKLSYICLDYNFAKMLIDFQLFANRFINKFLVNG